MKFYNISYIMGCVMVTMAAFVLQYCFWGLDEELLAFGPQVT